MNLPLALALMVAAPVVLAGVAVTLLLHVQRRDRVAATRRIAYDGGSMQTDVRTSAGAFRSLADLRDSTAVRVGPILFAAIRTYCEELGIAEGEVVRALGADRTQLRIVRADGRVVAVERSLARFIGASTLVHG